MTQKADLLRYLAKGHKVTRSTAFIELGIAELSSRIGELEADGWHIDRKRKTVTARNGRRCQVMEYSLDSAGRAMWLCGG